MGSMNIAFCTDSNYIIPTGIAMISICENNIDQEIFFHIIIPTDENDPICLPNLKDIADKYNKGYAEYHLSNSLLTKFGVSQVGHISMTTFARFFLPDLLPKTIKVLLYLDGDVVVNASLESLFDTNLDYYYMAAVPDVHGGSAVRHLSIGLGDSITYINAGVLLINLDYWRKENITAKLIDYAIEKKDCLPMMDQDVINKVLGAKTKLLSPTYNFISLFYFESELYWMIPHCFVKEVREIKKKGNPIIIHYGTQNKPWKNEWCPLREKWMKYCQLSQWKDFEVKDVVTRFDRSTVYNSFIEAYWSDTKLMKEMVYHCVKLQNISVRMKHKKLFVRLAMTPVKLLTNILEFVYKYKTT